MTDEVSTSFHISILVMCTAALVATVIGISTMSLNIMADYSDKYNQAIGQATESSIYALAQNGEAPMPVIYTTITEGINAVDRVRLTIKDSNGTVLSTEICYQYDDADRQNLTKLLSKYRLYIGRVTVKQGELNGYLITVDVEVIK